MGVRFARPAPAKAQLNSETFDEDDLTQNWDGPFGGSWKGALKLSADLTETFAGSRAASIFRMESTGSGANGPTRADNAIFVSSEKRDWKTSEVLGEVDGIYVAILQGKKGDAGGINIDHRRVYDAAEPYGSVGVEVAMRATDGSSDTTGVYYSVRSIVGGSLNTTDLRDAGFGFEARAGIGDIAGFTNQSPSTAFLATGDGANGFWDKLFVGANGLQTTNEFFVIQGTGASKNVPEIHMGVRANRIVEKYASNVLSWSKSTDGGSTLTEWMQLATGDLKITLADDSGAVSPNFTLYRNSASPAASDLLGRIKFDGRNSTPADFTYAAIQCRIVDPTGGSENANLEFLIGGTARLTIADTTDVRATGALWAHSSTAIPAGGTAGAGLRVSSTTNFGVFFGSGAPTLAAAKGSLYLRSDGSGTGDRAYINTDGSTTWTALTTAA